MPYDSLHICRAMSYRCVIYCVCTSVYCNKSHICSCTHLYKCYGTNNSRHLTQTPYDCVAHATSGVESYANALRLCCTCHEWSGVISGSFVAKEPYKKWLTHSYANTPYDSLHMCRISPAMCCTCHEWSGVISGSFVAKEPCK